MANEDENNEKVTVDTDNPVEELPTMSTPKVAEVSDYG
jgi:hypothetical protein